MRYTRVALSLTLPQLGGTFCITYSVCQATVQDIPKVLTEIDNDNNTSKLIMHIFFGKNLENKMNVFVEVGEKSHIKTNDTII
jgi:hypothetical protein